MDQTQDFKSMQDQIQAALIATTRISGRISSEDLGFQRSLNREVGPALDEQSERLLVLTSKLLKSAASISEISVPILDSSEDVENNWRSIVDVIDSLLEKTDISLDEYTGVIKRKDSPSTDQIPSKSKRLPLGNAFRTQNLVKPQLAFEVKPNNDDESPWRPLLTTKPHAIIPLEKSLGTFTNDFDQQQYDYTTFLPLLLLPPSPSTPEGLSKSQRASYNKRIKELKKMDSTRSSHPVGSTDNYFRFRHPYETEILQLKYPDIVYQKADPIPYIPFENTAAIFVDTEEGVLDMLSELKSATEIAVDLEHHDARSYVGLVSLMQISTRYKDWIVDTLKPWRQNLQVLNEVFADPKIVKVFHGAYMDIVWLQRDLGLYVVGLFDTHYASRTLGYPGGSLAYLLKRFIDFDADKKYQMADWRIRPLPDEMFFYARADTHFLLYIYDNMRNELIDRTKSDVPGENRIEQVLQKSKETTLLRHERQIYNKESGKGPGGWYSLLFKTPALLNNEQFAVYRAIHEWRDKIARADDDSTAFVMPNHIIMNIAKLMPMDMVALLGAAHPISYNVKSRSVELLEVIRSAKARGSDGPSMVDVLRPDTVGSTTKANIPSVTPQTASQTLVAVVDDDQLRSENSAFWGGAFGSSIWDAPVAGKSENELRLAVPLPQLSSEIFATAASSGLADRSKVAFEASLQMIQASNQPRNAEEAFVIKRGAKRKSDAISEGGHTNSAGDYDIPLNEEDEQAAREKAERKAEKKAEKKLKKAQRKPTEAAATEDYSADMDDEEPFDYSKADSVLHGKQSNGDQSGLRHKKPFDPYVKSADAPKGKHRLQTERAGKSHTFKS